MPAISAPASVLVTGANGYIAVWVVRTLLEKGYFVRGTVRSIEKGNHLKELFEEKYADKFELFIVEDIAAEGAFDEAVKGMDAIEHTASPFHMNAEDPQELIGPAVNGTIGVLKSALKNAPTVKRIVVTSSCASVLEATGIPKVYTEADWNNLAIRLVEEQGKAALAGNKYRASKTLAEKAAWKFVEENKGKIGWDLVCINPPYVFGPAIHSVGTTPTSLNTSLAEWYNTVVTPTTGGKSLETLKTVGNSWVDVRDVALAHLRAVEREGAGGQRVLVSGGTYIWQDWLDAANSLQPTPIPSHTDLPKGTPGAGKGPHRVEEFVYDTTKAREVLGIDRWITIEESARDMLADFERRGW